MSIRNNKKLSSQKRIREMCIFAMLGALMFCSKIIMEVLPNIHLLGTLTMVYTLTYRKKALIPIYIYVFLNGLYAGFNVWWIPYLYIWTVLWGITMLMPKKMPKKVSFIIYPVICSIHGFLFGILYSPAQALFFNLNFKQTIAWITTGAFFDLVHGISNFLVGFLIIPFCDLLKKLNAKLNVIN